MSYNYKVVYDLDIELSIGLHANAYVYILDIGQKNI